MGFYRRSALTEQHMVESDFHRHRDRRQDSSSLGLQFAEELFDTAHAIVLVLDSQGRILRLNPYMEQLSGYRLEEVQGKDWFEIFLPSRDRQRIRALFGRAINGIRTRGNINSIRTKGGQEREIEWFDAPLTDENSRLVALLCIGQDITEQKRAQRLLHDSQARLSAVLETAVDAIVTIDDTGVVTSFNPAAERIFGYRATEVIGHDVNVLMPEPYHSEHHRYISNYLNTGKKKIIGIGREVVGRRKDGSIFPIELTVSEINYETEHLFTGIVRDITERKKSEQERWLYQQQLRDLASQLSIAEERERRVIASELHDQVGQTLAAAKIKLGTLQQADCPHAVVRGLSEVRSLIEATIESTRALTFDLVSPVLHELGLDAAIESLIEDFRVRHNLSFHLENDGQDKPLSEGARVVLFKAVRELLFNIVKYARARTVHVSVKRVDTSVCICVEDDGLGFDTPEEGFQVSPRGGFGLFNIHERLDYLGGRLDVDSQQGRGTRITLTAPLDTSTPNENGGGI